MQEMRCVRMSVTTSAIGASGSTERTFEVMMLSISDAAKRDLPR